MLRSILRECARTHAVCVAQRVRHYSIVPTSYRESIHGNHISVLAYNVRSMLNLGVLFRTCDAFGVEKLYLGGFTAAPPRIQIAKTALGAEKTVPWEKHSNLEQVVEVLTKLKSDGYEIVSFESLSQTSLPPTHPIMQKGDISIYDFKPAYPLRLCLVFGNEVTGLQEDILQYSDRVVHIPMLGLKESLNVAVAAGIGLYALRDYAYRQWLNKNS